MYSFIYFKNIFGGLFCLYTDKTVEFYGSEKERERDREGKI